MLFAELTADGWATIIAAIGYVATTLFGMWLSYRKLIVPIRETKILVNSNWYIALKREAKLARRVAEMPGATVFDVEAAEQAERLLAEHERQQKQVDAQGN